MRDCWYLQPRDRKRLYRIIRRSSPLVNSSARLSARSHPTERALAHHTHLLRAAAAIGVALKEADGSLNVDRILTPLRAGYAELERAGNALPGFQLVSYEHACCGLGAK